MNKQQLIENATAKAFVLEYSEDLLGTELIGIGKGKGCYHWFKVYGEDVYFDHTYSCNTGSVKRGLSHAVKVQDSLGFYKD
jgi:hypothetical protein